MVKKYMHQKHIPLRTCVGCWEVLPKRSLIRVVKTSDGVKIDLSGKLPGRGAYIHENKSCWAKSMNGALAQALKTDLSGEDKQILLQFADRIKNNDELAS